MSTQRAAHRPVRDYDARTCSHGVSANAGRDAMFAADLIMLIGPSRTGQLLEVGVSHAEGIDFIIHAMPARAKFMR